ncbi:WD40-repeat-containing domain protein [Mycena rebaudengoi]|nr:WD40-repeat-containing domain protein [Mycena rebaudengoi]
MTAPPDAASRVPSSSCPTPMSPSRMFCPLATAVRPRWAHPSAIWLLGLLSPVLPEAPTSPSTPRLSLYSACPAPAALRTAPGESPSRSTATATADQPRDVGPATRERMVKPSQAATGRPFLCVQQAEIARVGDLLRTRDIRRYVRLLWCLCLIYILIIRYLPELLAILRDSVSTASHKRLSDFVLLALPPSTRRCPTMRYGEAYWGCEGNLSTVGNYRESGAKTAIQSRACPVFEVSSITHVESTSEEASLYSHGEWIRCVAFSPDGQHIASGSGDKTLCVRDAKSGALIDGLFKGHSFVRSISFSPDGRRIVTGSQGPNSLRLWDVQTVPTVAALFERHCNMVFSVGFRGVLSDGKPMVSDNVEPIAAPLRFRHNGTVYSVAFSPDGERIVSGSADTMVHVWNSQSEALFSVFKGRHSQGQVCRFLAQRRADCVWV